MNPRGFRLLIYGQVCFYVGVLGCVLIRPAGLAADHGLSYYGHYRYTLIPYAVALLGSAYYCFRAAKNITRAALKPLAVALTLLTALEVVLVLAPDLSADPWVLHIHTTTGALIFIDLLIVSGWLLAKLHYARWLLLCIAIELIGGIGAAIWLMPTQGFLIQSQLVFLTGANTALAYAAARFRDEGQYAPAEQQL